MEAGNLVYVKRTGGEKTEVGRDAFAEQVLDLLKGIQDELFAKAKAFRDEHTTTLDDRAAFDAFDPCFVPPRPLVEKVEVPDTWREPSMSPKELQGALDDARGAPGCAG